MTNVHSNEPTPRKPLRLWPGVVAVALQWLVRFVVPIFVPDAGGTAILGGIAGGLAVIVWWLFFSRAPWSERVGALVLMVVALFATSRLVHESISNGMMGMMLPIFAIPVLSLALVSWAVASRRLSSGPRRASMVAAILLACGVLTLLRTGGITGSAASDVHWRWTQSPEERLLAQTGDRILDDARGRPVAPSSAPAASEPTAPATAPEAEKTPESPESLDSARGNDSARGKPTSGSADPTGVKTDADWPGFRGPARDNIVRGVRIETDWSRKSPVQLWRRPIGPGWSSFAVHGTLVYTQEQRGDDEIVSCYNLTTGAPVWMHRDAARFWESNGGAGPRGTPTLSNGRVYAFGATGILNALDARNGSVVWSRNAASDTGAQIPGWGFASSPLVFDDVVIVAASGRLAAYAVETGNLRWSKPARGGSYSSPHLMTIGGVAQVLLTSGAGVTSVAPTDGTLLWEHEWKESGMSIVQPALAANGDVLIPGGDAMGGLGLRRLAVAHGSTGWTVEERWTSAGLKPYFNDFVLHKGHAFGFDGSILASIDLEDGKRKWKGGRYGHGQLVLLPDQDLLLVLSEEGELALVGATADQFRELARFPAIEGKTWNHPVLVGDVLLVRNGEEMAAFRVSLASADGN
jgi:outer membrane protein assembly factor BamB